MSKEIREQIDKIKNYQKQSLNEDIEFLLDKESDEYNHIVNDYGIKNINKVHNDVVKSSREAINIFKDNVDLFDDIRIVFVNNIREGALGRFRGGTSTSIPIVLLSEKDILSASKKYNVPLWVTVETTIFHELGHAICELEYNVFENEYLEYNDEEEWVEQFAYDLHNYGDIPNDLEKFLIEYKKQK
jgi:hypothetical protein